jgi:hypothetical protein
MGPTRWRRRKIAPPRRCTTGSQVCTLDGMRPRAVCSASRCGSPKPTLGCAQWRTPGLPIARRLVLGLASAAGSLALPVLAPPLALSSPWRTACALSKQAGPTATLLLCVLAPTLTGPQCCLCGGKLPAAPDRTREHEPTYRAGRTPALPPPRSTPPTRPFLHGAGVAGISCKSRSAGHRLSQNITVFVQAVPLRAGAQCLP